MPLKKIPRILSPDLLYILSSMGHGDEIVLADAYFPSASVCRCGPKEIRADGIGAADLLRGIMELFPLDQYVEKPVAVMHRVPEDEAKGLPVPIWDTFQEIVDSAEGKKVQIEQVERFAFYERAKRAFAVVHTGEPGQWVDCRNLTRKNSGVYRYVAKACKQEYVMLTYPPNVAAKSSYPSAWSIKAIL